MPTYIVQVQEVYNQPVMVKDVNEKDAIGKAENGEGEYLDDDRQYSYTLESDTWTAQLYEDE